MGTSKEEGGEGRGGEGRGGEGRGGEGREKKGKGGKIAEIPSSLFFRAAIDCVRLINEEHMVAGSQDG